MLSETQSLPEDFGVQDDLEFAIVPRKGIEFTLWLAISLIGAGNSSTIGKRKGFFHFFFYLVKNLVWFCLFLKCQVFKRPLLAGPTWDLEAGSCKCLTTEFGRKGKPVGTQGQGTCLLINCRSKPRNTERTQCDELR
jgi:hypothetical protein